MVGLSQRGDQWRITVPTDPVTELKVAINAGSARLDLADAHVPDVSVSVNAGDSGSTCRKPPRSASWMPRPTPDH